MGLRRLCVLFCLLAPALVFTACGGGSSSNSSNNTLVSLAVTPVNSTLDQGATQQFNASVVGSSNVAVTWSVQEGAAGGSITGAGIYTAPNAAGTFHVVATSQATGIPTNPPAADGPGRESDPLVKLAVERYAEDRAIEWLNGQGWVCKRIGAPFELRCTKGDRELHAEVKGTRGKGKVVKLTRNEVRHNQEPCTCTAPASLMFASR